MIHYLDASALVKMIADEQDTDVARAIARDASSLTTVAVAYVEIRAALARRHGPQSRSSAAAAAGRVLDARWLDVAKVPVTDGLIMAAGEVAERRQLRALDAIHVAAARQLADTGVDQVVFVSWDQDQRSGARAEGLTLLPDDQLNPYEPRLGEGPLSRKIVRTIRRQRAQH